MYPLVYEGRRSVVVAEGLQGYWVVARLGTPAEPCPLFYWGEVKAVAAQVQKDLEHYIGAGYPASAEFLALFKQYHDCLSFVKRFYPAACRF